MAQAKSMAQNKNTKTTATTKLTASEEALKKEIVGKVNRHFGKVMEDATPHRFILHAHLLFVTELWKSGPYLIRL